MEYDLVDKRIKGSQLQIDLQHLPQSIYSALSSFDEAFVLLDANLIVAFAIIRQPGGILSWHD